MKDFVTRLAEAKALLAEVEAMLGRHLGGVSQSVELLRDASGSVGKLDHWVDTIRARRDASSFLDRIDRPDPQPGLEPEEERRVRLGQLRVDYRHARLVGVQAYLTLNWAIADGITAHFAPLFCTPKAALDRTQPLNLSGLITRKTDGAAHLCRILRDTYGWPVGIYYAIRNVFVHNAGRCNGSDFFEGPEREAGFRVTEEAWSQVLDRAKKEYGIESSMAKRGVELPDKPPDDLRAVFAICEGQMDEALGFYVGSACHALRAHAVYLVGED